MYMKPIIWILLEEVAVGSPDPTFKPDSCTDMHVLDPGSILFPFNRSKNIIRSEIL